MANLDLLVVGANGAPARTPSQGVTIDFDAVRIGADNLQIAQAGSGVSAVFDFGARNLRSSATPTNANDLANKAYVDLFLNGVTGVKSPVRLATAAALPASTPSGSGVGKTITGDANGALTVDGVSVVLGDRILLKNQLAGLNNGIYEVTQVGDGSNPFILTRATDFDQDSEVSGGVLIAVQEGADNADLVFILTTNDPITVDTTALDFVEYPVAIVAGAGLSKSGAVIDVVTGDGLRIEGGSVVVDPTRTKTNDNAGAITARQVVYVKADGDVDLAAKNTSNLVNFALGLVEDASIAAGSPGNIILVNGYILDGFSGLTPGREYYVSGTAGGIDLYENITWAGGDHVYKVGRAISATELRFEPKHQFIY